MANKREWAEAIESALIEQLINLGWNRTAYGSFVTVLGAYQVTLSASTEQATVKTLHILPDRSRKTLSITKIKSNKDIISINNSLSSPKQVTNTTLYAFPVKADKKTNLLDLARQVVELSVIPILINNITVSNVPK